MPRNGAPEAPEFSVANTTLHDFGATLVSISRFVFVREQKVGLHPAVAPQQNVHGANMAF
jgi:hypothetical protein